MRTKSLSVLATAVAAVGFYASSANAAIVWGVDNLGTANAGTVGDRVIRFDTAAPNLVQVVGATGVAATQMSGLDFAPSGILYAVGAASGSGANLYRINQTSGAATLIGALGTAAGVAVTDLAYDPALGRMVGLAFNGAGPTVRVFNISLATGVASSPVTITGIPSGSADLGLSFDSTGTAYIEDTASDNMYKVSGSVATAMSAGIGADCAFSQGMTMDWSVDDAWYLARTGPAAAPFTSDFRLMDNTTGGTTSVLATFPTDGTTGLPEYELGDIAIRPTATPEPASVAIFALGALAMGARRRRRD